MSRPPALLMGVPVDDLTMDETIELIAHLVDLGRATSRRHQIATVNLDFLTNAIEDEAIRHRLQAADVGLVDGTPPLWAAAALGMPLRERVAGSDLVPELFSAAAARGWAIHCVGSAPEVAAGVERFVADRHPVARITVDPGPRVGADGDAPLALIDEIADRDPDILLVALGHPKQEHFIAVHGERLGVPVMMGIGGTLDMMVGKRVRAPSWMRTVGLEWVFRALQEPRRLLPRYLRDIRVAVPAFYRQWRGNARRRVGGHWAFRTDQDTVTASWVPTPPDGQTTYDDAFSAIRDGSSLCIHLPVGDLRDAEVAPLVGLYRACRLYHRGIEWRGRPDPRLAARMNAVGLFPAAAG